MPYMNVPIRYLLHPSSYLERRKDPVFSLLCAISFASLVGYPFLLLHDNRHQTLGILDVDGLHVAVELLLGVLLVVSSTADADAESVRNTLDTLLPDLLVQLGV